MERSVNLFKPNGISHSYQLDQPISILWVYLGGIFHFYKNFNRIFSSGDPDQMPQPVASDLGLHCLHMSHKKDARLIWISAVYIHSVTCIQILVHNGPLYLLFLNQTICCGI